ncbi:glycosyl transferase group 1 [Emericellopsis atlantica]|uniref:Glycosyl transferase group 1 n=1 Tax=Emericellopsis atlantica TaxID=2614577 RepID=A0A9P8CRR8_9HYPO|nr:glycosyl transferase group 1 [Emericellopsis atlantica]KAG9256602.1 glycosyl transferase group 1 [Emericellopsis atlantica]
MRDAMPDGTASSGEPGRFTASESHHHKRRMSLVAKGRSHFGPPLTILYLGMSVSLTDDGDTANLAIAAHDATYLLDSSEGRVRLRSHDRSDPVTSKDPIAEHVIPALEKYEKDNFFKVIGAGIPIALHELSPTLCSKLWLELDIVPIVMEPEGASRHSGLWNVKSLDEQADSMGRKCIMHFGPSLAPLLHVGFKGRVQTDAAFRACLTTLENHRDTCGPKTWDSMLHFARQLKDGNTRIAFFSSTPQGGGVALMRHALVRLSQLTGVHLRWYVPKPRAGVFRITKNIHNILQGVNEPGQHITYQEKQLIVDWIVDNANRYWLCPGGPLRPPGEGGAHVIVVDDPQMPGLIPVIKKLTPDRPVLYRSHIQIRSDLVAKTGSPQEDVWSYLWENIRHADMFISHPIPSFVPKVVPKEKVAYLPATTDWLDGLNKPLNRFDTGYYGHLYDMQCHEHRTAELAWPARNYIVQIARFDPSKGLPDVIASYGEFRRLCEQDGVIDPPQLCICGNGSIDDPDASTVYDQTMTQLETDYPDLVPDCSIMRLEPNDQLLNTLVANAHVVLQLSTREGFEVKVSEALHAGRPVIATKAGGIPLQVKDRVNGFLVDVGDHKSVAQHLLELFSDDELHKKMSLEAKRGVSDEVGTVGNALAWYYLGAKWREVGARGLKAHGRWVNDMAREEAGQPYQKGENRLPRSFTEQASA